MVLLAQMNAIKTNTEGMEKRMEGMENKMEVNIDGVREEMREMRGEMWQVGQCLQAGKMATPRAGSSELKGSAPAGEDRVIRETCWTRYEVTRREKLNGATETCTAGREVTELTVTREMEERLHGVEGEEDAHTHTRM